MNGTKRHVEFVGNHANMLEKIAKKMDVPIAIAARLALKGYYEQIFLPATSENQTVGETKQPVAAIQN